MQGIMSHKHNLKTVNIMVILGRVDNVRDCALHPSKFQNEGMKSILRASTSWLPSVPPLLSQPSLGAGGKEAW
jgi:hypothetical protein